MFHTARTSVRTMLVAAGAAGFVALGTGIAGADTLGGLTDELPLDDLGHQVSAVLDEGVGTPVGDLVKVEPGEVSAQPEVQHQSADVTETVGHVFGDTVSAATPVETGEDNATNVGPLDLGEATESLPLGGASEKLPLSAGDPLSDLLGGIGLLDALPVGGDQTLPLGHDESPRPLASQTAVVDDTVRELGSRVQRGVQEGDPRLVTLDEVNLDALSDTVPMSAPIDLDTGQNTDLAGGFSTLLPADVQEGLPAADLGLPVGPAGIGEPLPMAAGVGSLGETDPVGRTLLPQTPGGDLVDVQGLPHLGAPEVDVDRLSAADAPLLDEVFDLGSELPVDLV